MENLGIVLVITGIVAAIVTILFSIYDMVQRKKFFNGKAFRSEKTAFSFDLIIEKNNLVKKSSWLKQRNKGFNPKTYKKRIKYVTHLSDEKCVIPRKGL